MNDQILDHPILVPIHVNRTEKPLRKRILNINNRAISTSRLVLFNEDESIKILTICGLIKLINKFENSRKENIATLSLKCPR